MKYCMIVTSVSSQGEADKIAEALLSAYAAACIQQFAVTSSYRWKGSLERAQEIMLLIKTRDSSYNLVEKIIRENHSYEVCEIIKLPIEAGSKAYLDWIESETSNN
ncbi:MAG: divalent-cation tolerance protein CutA [Candidatus Riflebacteria bacterium]|nr:divalent-cation tolerance protein CutA [Candidatus Riflebacteria bacterium]